MPRVRTIQRRATQGEIDPKLVGRSDLDAYGGCMASMKNVFPLSQGGFTRRPGTVGVDSPIAGAVKCVEFRFSRTDTYLLMFMVGVFRVYKDSVWQGEFAIPAFDTDDKIERMSWTQGGDTMLLFHEDVPTQKVVRNSDTSWSVSQVVWDFVPLYPFTLTEDHPAGDLDPNPDFDNTEALETTTPWPGVCYAERFSGTWTFQQSDVNQYIRGIGGYARITHLVSDIKVQLWAEIPFPHWKPIKGGDWTLLHGYEPVWSASRGYPRCGVFHDGRLYIGGSKSLPSTIWGSKVGEYFNFDKASLYDSDAIERSLDVGTYDKIVNLYSGRSLFVFTTGGEIAIAPPLSGPLSPSNFAAAQQTSIGSREGTRVVEQEGSVLFVQGAGVSLQELVYNNTQDAFTSTAVSWLASHLTTGVKSIAMRRSTSVDEGAYLLGVNDDGTAFVANILQSQNIMSFVPLVTDGAFVECGIDGQNMYFIIDRSGMRQLERLDFSLTLDSAKVYTEGFPISTATGLIKLEGKTVKVIADGAVQADKTVTGGVVTLDDPATESLIIGLDYDVEVIDLPVEVQELGTVMGRKKNVSSVHLELRETQNMSVNGNELCFGSGETDLEYIPEFTGIKHVNGLRGWGRTGQVSITQTAPLKMTVLTMSKKVNV